jgi:signal transduction protein with GAF and PtsI domain
MRFDARLGIAGAVAMTGQTINAADAYEHPLFYKEVDIQTGYRTRTLLAVPLHDLDGKIIGVGEAINKLVGHFSDEDAEILATLAAHLTDFFASSPIRGSDKSAARLPCRRTCAAVRQRFHHAKYRRHERPYPIDHPAHRSNSLQFGGRADSWAKAVLARN